MAKIHLQQIDSSFYYAKGAVLNGNGQRKAKKHCLGTDYNLAMRKATQLNTSWELETTVDPASGLKVWGPGAIEAALAFVTSATPTPAIKKAPEKQVVMAKEEYVPPPSSYTFEAALKDWVAYYAARNDVSERWRSTCSDVIPSIIRVLKNSKSLTLPMSAITQEHLDQMRAIVVSRPQSQVSGKRASVA